jgi:hypothetical protein
MTSQTELPAAQSAIHLHGERIDFYFDDDGTRPRQGVVYAPLHGQAEILEVRGPVISGQELSSGLCAPNLSETVYRPASIGADTVAYVAGSDACMARSEMFPREMIATSMPEAAYTLYRRARKGGTSIPFLFPREDGGIIALAYILTKDSGTSVNRWCNKDTIEIFTLPDITVLDIGMHQGQEYLFSHLPISHEIRARGDSHFDSYRQFLHNHWIRPPETPVEDVHINASDLRSKLI